MKIPDRLAVFLKKIMTKDKLILLFLFGILLIVIALPLGKSKKKDGASSNERVVENSSPVTENTTDYIEKLEQKIEAILCKTYGVGNAKVLINPVDSGHLNLTRQVNSSKKNSLSQAEAASESNNEYTEEESIVYTLENGVQKPFVVQTELPKIQGVVVIAQGAGNASVVKEITDAVSALLGISVNKIKVLRMEVN